jgi:hypothetical protein
MDRLVLEIVWEVEVCISGERSRSVHAGDGGGYGFLRDWERSRRLLFAIIPLPVQFHH